MSLFSSPAFRVLNSENSESMIQRKPGSNLFQTRKPFVDRTVNCNTPDVNKKEKPNVLIKENVKISSPTCTTDDLEIKPEYYCSYKNVEDQFEDLVPYSKRLEEHHIFSILKSYLDDNTPPPSPTSMNVTFETPEIDYLSPDSSFNSNRSFDNMFFELPKGDTWGLGCVEEVDLPDIDIDSL